MAVITLFRTFGILDLFLTGEAAERGTQDVLNASRFFSGDPEMRVLLSDRKTILVLRWSSPEDPRCAYLVTNEEDLGMYRKWKRIDNKRSQPVEMVNP
jgi:hypothetical protein